VHTRAGEGEDQLSAALIDTVFGGLGTGRHPRSRPRRLNPAPPPAGRTRTRQSRTRDHSQGAAPPTRPAHHPRPPPHPPPRPGRAVGIHVHHRVAAGHPASGPHLTAGHHPDKDQEGGDRHPLGPVEPDVPHVTRRPVPTWHGT
jgi:hypothetical protein